MSDTISRQAAIEAIRNIKAIKGTSDDKILLIDKAEAQTELMMLPTEERKGHWKGYIDNPDWLRTDGSPIFMSCSECNGTVLKTGSLYWNYCPECGADMRGEQDE